jgi:predicted aspartyl protease
MGIRAISAGALCALALAMPARAQGSWPAECKLVAAASLPFHLVGGQLAVDVQANGTPRQFIVNTGAFASSINEKVADDLHLQQFGIRPNIRITDAGDAKATHFTHLDSLLIGNLDAKDIRLMVQENGPDGEIAPDLLRNFDVEIDFPNRTINFFRPHPCSGKAVYWTDKFSAVDIDITKQGHIRVPVELNGRALYALLGTGNSSSLLAADIADARFGIAPQGPERITHGSQGGEVTVSATPFDSLKIGDTVLQKPVIGLSSSEHSAHFDESSLILGMREMSKFHIYIAYRERKLYLSEESSAPSAAITVTAGTLAPAEAIAAAKRAAPAPFAGTFIFQVQSAGWSNGQLFLNSEADFHDPANLAVVMPLAEAAKLPAGGVAADVALKGKHITVVGGARVVRVQQLRNGQPAGEPQIQVRIPVTSASQVSVTP